MVSEAAALRVEAKLEVVRYGDSGVEVVSDITERMRPESSRVSRYMGDERGVHGQLELHLEGTLNWSDTLLRPSMVLTDLATQETETAVLGVYRAEIAGFTTDAHPLQTTVRGLDATSYLDYPYGHTVYIPEGTNTVAWALNSLRDFTPTFPRIELSDSARLPTSFTFPNTNRTTPRYVINSILEASGYDQIFADRDGYYSALPYIAATQRLPLLDIDLTSPAPIASSIVDYRTDLHRRPNRWLFIRDNPDLELPSMESGLLTVTNAADGPASVQERGIVITDVVRLAANTQESLLEQAQRIVDRGKWPDVEATFRATPQLGLWHGDIVLCTVPDIGWDEQRCEVVNWQLPLDGNDMLITVSAVF